MKTYPFNITRKPETEYKDNTSVLPGLLENLNDICERLGGSPIKPHSYDPSQQGEITELKAVYLLENAVITNTVSSGAESTKITYIGDKKSAELIQAFRKHYGDDAEVNELKTREIKIPPGFLKG